MAHRSRRTSPLEDLLESLFRSLAGSSRDERRRGEGRRYFPKPLLTPSELKFHGRLKEALPQLDVMAQVCMGALVTPPASYFGKVRERARYKYQSKMIDFTVFDPSANKVVCLIELDDPSHDGNGRRDAERDEITAEAGYQTLRWDVRRQPSLEEIRDAVLAVQQGTPEGPDIVSQAPSMDPLVGALQRIAVTSPSDALLLKIASLSWRQLVLLAAGGLLVAGLVLYSAPKVIGWALKETATAILSPLLPKQKPVAKKPVTYEGTLGQRKAVKMTWPSCLVYGDARKLAAARQSGCTGKEIVTFQFGLDATSLEEWHQFSLSRLQTKGGCDQYRDWAGEIVNAGGEPGHIFEQLETLYSDALEKGCLRSPK